MNISEIVECHHISIHNVYTATTTYAYMTSDICNCIVNAILAILTSIGNACVILAYHGNQGLKTKANLLIVALAFTDLLVGVFVQPLYLWVKVKQMTGTIDCLLEVISDLSTKFSFTVSLLTLGLVIATERFIAVFYPLKHYVWLTKRKLLYSFAFIWVVTAVFTLIILLGVPRVVYQSLGLILIVLTLATSLILYIKIAVKLHAMKTRVVPTQGNTHARIKRVSCVSNASQTRAAVTMFYVLGSLFICWIPMLSGFVYVSTKGQNLVYQQFLWTWGVTCIYLNSFCNPFIYSWRNRNMSSAIRRLFVKDREITEMFSMKAAVSTARQSHTLT